MKTRFSINVDEQGADYVSEVTENTVTIAGRDSEETVSFEECGKAQLIDILRGVIRQAEDHRFPHCDPRILHAPNKCVFCDMSPDWQKAREAWRVNFTDEQDPTKTQCPAEAARGETINRWLGNTAVTQEQLDERDREMEKITKEFEELRKQQENEKATT